MGDGQTKVRNPIAASAYPVRHSERNRWILERRGPKNVLDPLRPYVAFWEGELGPDGDLVSTATLLLTNTECPFRCVMCDLWRNTLDVPTPRGAIVAQIDHALASLAPARQIKLYNAGSFFDPRAIPPEDDNEIAARLQGFERVIVECHPAFIGERSLRFARRLPGRLEVAIGLETVHPGVLARLNKRMTVDSFRRSAEMLADNGIDLRVFLLVRPPWMSEAERVEWACRSLDTAFDTGATACTLIPTRAGNGAMDALKELREFAPPRLSSVEAAQEYGLSLCRGRVFCDTWDLEMFFDCDCSHARAARLEEMNRTQRVPESVLCDRCGAGA
jgi:radical SAM enzyme (TIGR01210 family)